MYPTADPGPLVPHNIAGAEKPVKLAYAIRLREINVPARAIARILGVADPHTVLRWLTDWDKNTRGMEPAGGLSQHIEVPPDRFRTGPRRTKQ